MYHYLLKYFALITVTALFYTPVLSQDHAEKAEDVTPLLISSVIPDVELKDIDGNTVNLRNTVSQKPTILIFYRGGWCPYCSRHLSELQQIEDELYDIGYQIIAISPDRPEKLKTTLQKVELDYTLMSDSPMTATKAFGLAFKVDQETVDRYKTMGLDLEGDSGYDHHLLPAPAVYILNTEGIVKFNYVNPDYKERINGEVLLTAAEAYFEE
jgi:peroxiredoxin